MKGNYGEVSTHTHRGNSVHIVTTEGVNGFFFLLNVWMHYIFDCIYADHEGQLQKCLLRNVCVCVC